MTFDFPAGRAQPSAWRFVVATAVAVLLSLAACAVLVVIGTAVFPSTRGYPHYAFADYGRLTIVGVVLACLAWPVATLISSKARRPFLLLTILVTVVGLAPDFWILLRGAPADAVVVLIAMHIALAVITYPALVLIAPQRVASRAAAAASAS